MRRAHLMLLPLLVAVAARESPPTPKAPTTKPRPNLVYILNDDTDVLLGSEGTLRQTRALLADQGAHFTHFRTLSPKCTPSRTGQLAGRHYHNVRPEPRSPKKTGRGLNQSTMFEPTSLFPMLHANGYARRVGRTTVYDSMPVCVCVCVCV